MTRELMGGHSVADQGPFLKKKILLQQTRHIKMEKGVLSFLFIKDGYMYEC
jgi:hypothetical protein